MHRTGLIHTLVLTLLLVGTSFVAVPQAAAQMTDSEYSEYEEQILDGEPTNPEDILEMLGYLEVDLADYDLNDQEPEETEAAQTWFQALLDLLQSIIAPEDTGS